MIRALLLACTVPLIGIGVTLSLSSDSRRADFTYVNPSGIHTLDPARMSWTQDFRVALNIWEGLTTWHPETVEPIAGAAVFPPVVSEDGLTYTFTIREDARWSNGDTLTSADFVRGWRRALEPGTATDYTFLLTDTIAGAAEYVRWRREGVAAITTLKRLADGWGIENNQATALMEHAAYDRVRAAAENQGVSLPKSAEDAEWQSPGTISAASPDFWNNLHSCVLRSHAGELDKQFSRVGIWGTSLRSKVEGRRSEMVARSSTPDPRTLTVQLIRPCGYFLDLVAMPIFLPCHESIDLLRQRPVGVTDGDASSITDNGLVVYDPQWTKPDYFANDYPGLITNGPYRLAEWTFKRRARLVVNDHYHGAANIKCRTVDMMVYENVNAAIMAYEAGDVDFLPAMDVPYDHEIARLARSGERTDFRLSTILATYFLNFNCVNATVNGRPNPVTNPKVRRALSMAIDKASIVEHVLMRGDRVAHTFVPPGAIPGYTSPTGLRYDVEKARATLADAGYPGGNGLGTIELLYPPSDERVCVAIARMWEETLGVRVELISKESKTFAEDKAAHRFMIARGNWYADYNDPTTFLGCLTSGTGNNDSGYSNAAYDELIAQANQTRDPKRRMQLLREAETIVVEKDLPILPILHYTAPVAIGSHVHGLYPNTRLWFPFKHVTVTR